jgi:flagellar secretion chaperone FliS
MFGLHKNGVSEYAKIGLETGVLAASPNKLIVMLYEGAILACHSAITQMQQKNIQQKGVLISKAIIIIESGLRVSLDKKAGGEIAESLDALYAYMSQRLAMANIRNQPELVLEVIQLLTELKSAWEEIGKQPMKESAFAQVATSLGKEQVPLQVDGRALRYAGG